MFATFKNRVSNYLNRYAKAKTHQLLLGLDDDLLEQANISRELLQRGVGYWPWQIETDHDLVNHSVSQQSVARPAIKAVASEASVAPGQKVDPVAIQVTDNMAATERAA